MSSTAIARQTRIIAVAIAAACLTMFLALRYEWMPHVSSPLTNRLTHMDQSVSPINERCAKYPDPGNIAVALKTGATEAAERIPMVMLTSFQCAENVVIFSDLGEEIAGHHIHDVLAHMSDDAKSNNTDFDFYYTLKEAQRFGQVQKMLKDLRSPNNIYESAAWSLDKYKFLYTLEQIYAQYPDKDWYLFVEADTYLVWPNLLTWLPELPDPRQNKLYLGSAAYVKDQPFAHGGSGYLLSHAAVHEFAVNHAGTAAQWDGKVQEHCCGDFVLALALKEMGIELKQAWPTLNGEKPATLPFGPSHWCQPVVTMHHVSVAEMNQLAVFEQERNDTGPVTFEDMFRVFVRDVLPEHRMEHWDNQNSDLYAVLADSFEDCWAACMEDEECFQIAFHGNICFKGHSIHLGEPKKPDSDGIWTSAWVKGRINKWLESQDECRVKFPWTSNSWFG